MRCEILAEFSQLQQLSTAWREWARRDARADVFQGWEWADAYWEAYGQGFSVWSPVVYEGHEPIAILPLVRRGGEVRFLSSPWSDYNDILCAENCSPAVLETALRAMLRDPSDWTRCLFDCLLPNSRIVRFLESMPQEFRSRLQLLQCSLAPTILLRDDRAEVLKKLVNKNQLKRYHHKLNKTGRVTFRHLETRQEAHDHLDNFFHQHITRWAMVGIKSEFLSTQHRSFYRAMVDKLNPQAELRFGVLELDARPIAYHFGFQVNGKLTWYKPAFDINYENFCPGGVLLRCLFQYAGQVGLTELDFSRGVEPYKYRYCNHVKNMCMLYVDRYPNHVASRARQIERRARESIRKRPSLARAIRRIPTMLSDWYFGIREAVQKRTPPGGFGHLIRRSTEEAVFSRAGDAQGEPSSARVIGKPLEGLAVLLGEWPEMIGRARLREARKRLKAGDRMLVVIGQGEPSPVIMWTGKRAEISLPVDDEDQKLSLPAEAWLIYDIWLARGRSHESISCDIMRAALQQDRGAEHWIVCSDALPVPQSAVEGAGFQLRKRVSRHGFFRRLWRAPVSESR